MLDNSTKTRTIGVYKVYKLLSVISLPQNRLNRHMNPSSGMRSMLEVEEAFKNKRPITQRPRKEVLEKLYAQGLGSVKLGKIFGVSRCTILRWMTKYGIKRRNKLWTEEEIVALKKLYPKGEKETLLAKLENRKWNGIRNKAGKLGLRFPNTKYKFAKKQLEKLYNQMGFRRATQRLGMARSTFFYLLKKDNIKLKGLLKNPDLSPSVNLFYVLGVLKGDGFTCINKKHRLYTVGLMTISKKFAESFANALKKIGLRPSLYVWHPPVSPKRKQTYRVTACSKKFVQWYRALSCEEIKNIVKKRKELAATFVRGFYESEGSYYLAAGKYPRITICNTQPHLLVLIKELLSQIGVDVNFRAGGKTKVGTQVYYLYKGGKDAPILICTINPCIKNEPSNLARIRKTNGNGI